MSGTSIHAVFAFCLAAVLAAQASPAFAWGADGHRIVCAIAWDEMMPPSRKHVAEILHVETRGQFADTCNWADDYRETHRETGGWHFVNVPPGATAVDTQRDCTGPRSCVIEQIAADRNALSDRHRGLDKAEALKFLGHFVGDLHQPLHVSYARDKGGNDIKGTFFGKSANLHEIWDYGLIDHDGRPWQQIADDLEAKVTSAERMHWAKSTPLDWANESLAITLAPATGYVNHGDTFALGEVYERQEFPVALDRLKRAGVRLGVILSDALK